MKKSITIFLGLIGALVLFAGCSVSSSSFDIELGEMKYYSGSDKVHVEVVCSNSNAHVRDAECWWTFDGTEPTENSANKNFDDFEESDDEFDMVIPSDFYAGNIKFLCKIKYNSMGKKKTITKEITKSFSTKYHSVGSRASCDLYKGKGYQNEYLASTTSVTGSNTFNVKENGTLKISFLLGSGLFKVDAESIPVDTPSYSKQVSAGDAVTVYYHSDIVAVTSSADGTKSGEYLLILE